MKKPGAFGEGRGRLAGTPTAAREDACAPRESGACIIYMGATAGRQYSIVDFIGQQLLDQVARRGRRGQRGKQGGLPGIEQETEL